MPAKTMTPDFTQSFDARDWAAAFVRLVTEKPEVATDEGTMLGWFANALMRGYDEHARQTSEYLFPDEASLASMSEAERVAEYHKAVAGSGLSDAEIKGTIWPNEGPEGWTVNP